MTDALTITQQTRLDDIAQTVRASHRRAAAEMIAIGEALIEALEILHGGFEQWVEDECDISRRLARNFIYIAGRFRDRPAIIAGVPSTIVYSLAAPSTPDAVIDEVVNRVKDGESLRVKDVQAMIDAHKPRRTPSRSNGAHQAVADAAAQVKEEIIATGGYVAVNGETIAGAINEHAAEALRADSELVRQRIEAEQGLDGAAALRGKATVDYISRDGRVTLYAPELASALRNGQHITFIIYPKETI